MATRRVRSSAVIVVGGGRAGGSLAASLRRARVAVRLVRARSLRGPRPLNAGVVLLAVPDRVIADFAARVLVEDGAVVAHTAGACGMAVLSTLPRGRPGVFHPLASLDGRAPVPRGCLCAWDAADEEAGARLVRLARRIGLSPARVRDGDRARYHAGAVIAGNLATALLHLGVEQLVAAGIDVDVARASLARLLASTAERALRAPLGEALTGPVARGDVDTVARHLRAIPPGPARDAYRLLTRVLIDQVKPGARALQWPLD